MSESGFSFQIVCAFDLLVPLCWAGTKQGFVHSWFGNWRITVIKTSSHDTGTNTSLKTCYNTAYEQKHDRLTYNQLAYIKTLTSDDK